METKENKKQDKKKEIILNDRVVNSLNDKNQDKNLIKYNDLKEQLKYNLKDDIENKIQRMKILYEIKKKELYKYDGFKSFNQFIKSFVIAKSQAYFYLRIYQKVLEGAVSIDKIKEIGFQNIYEYIQKSDSDVNLKDSDQNYNENIPIRILVKDKEVYNFCKEDTKRLYFIIEEIYKNNKDILLKIMSKYEERKKKKINY